MKKVAIVGVEGSGKTVMLAGLGELYSHPDENGYFLAPRNFATASYAMSTIAKMRQGQWPSATAEDVLQVLDWTIRCKESAVQPPVDVCELTCLDFAGEVYRAAFGINAGAVNSNEVNSLKEYIRSADGVIVLINLRDVINNGLQDRRVQESMWITNAILEFAFDTSDGHTPPTAAIMLSQADSYSDTIKLCGGAKGVLEKHLPHVANSYGWLPVFDVKTVDKTLLNEDGYVVPAPDFTLEGLKGILLWVLQVPQQSERSMSAEKQYNMGLKYANGNGVAQNYLEAVKWYRMAAEKGECCAQNNLGLCYQYGRGVGRNLKEARKWYQKAVDQGYENARSNLANL